MQRPNPLITSSFIQKLQWVFDPIAYLENAAKKHPDIFTGEVVGFGDTVVFISHPQAIQEVLKNDSKKFISVGKLSSIFEPLLGTSSIAMLDSEPHKRKRKILMPTFHGERMRGYGQLISFITKEILSQLSLEKPFTGLSVTKDIVVQVILQVVFGLYKGERCQQLRLLMPLLLEIFESPFTSSFFMFPELQKDLGAWSPWGKFLRQRQQVDELLYMEIAERRQQPISGRSDILSLLMTSIDEEGKGLTDQELRDDLITLIFAGHDTTATSLAWALYWVHKNPEVKEKLVQEIDSLGDSPDPMSIFGLPYLTAVCNETLRIYPVSMFTLPRVTQETVELLGHQLEANTIIQCCIYLTHQREDLYPEPKHFKPERFLERQFSNYEFLPFGGGVRSCIGASLAMFEMKLVLATILSHYQLELFESQPEYPQRRGIIIGPGRGVKMVVRGVRKTQKPLVAVEVY